MLADQLSFSVPLIDLKGDLSQEEVLCIDGVAEGKVYRQLRTWLTKSPHRFLVFLEEDEGLFERARQELWARDPKVRIFLCQEHSEELFKEIAWEFLFLKFSYVSDRTAPVQSLFSQVEYTHRAVDLIASDYRDMGVSVISNLIHNQARWKEARQGQSLKGRFQRIPAIICGGGVSLATQMEALIGLQDKALIWAGGSAMNLFAKAGARPHFAAHFDPDPPRQAFLRQEAFEVPHFYQNRFSSSLLGQVHAPLLWMPEGGNYPIEKWLKQQRNVDVESLDSGWTVANFCAATALLLGCDPIIFVGIEFSAKEEMEGLDMKTEDEQGQVCYTRKDWVMSAEWLGALAASRPDRQWINATVRGLPIAAMGRQSLDTVIANTLHSFYDLPGMVHAACETATEIPVYDGPSAQVQITASYVQCEAVCNRLLSLWETHYPQSPMEKGGYALALVDLEQEIAYQLILEPMWQIWKRPILRTEGQSLGQHLHRLLFFKRAIDAHLKGIA